MTQYTHTHLNIDGQISRPEQVYLTCKLQIWFLNTDLWDICNLLSYEAEPKHLVNTSININLFFHVFLHLFAFLKQQGVFVGDKS